VNAHGKHDINKWESGYGWQDYVAIPRVHTFVANEEMSLEFLVEHALREGMDLEAYWKDCWYKGVDFVKVFQNVVAALARATPTPILTIRAAIKEINRVNSVTFSRGFNRLKITNNWTNEAERANFIRYMANCGVVASSNGDPNAVTLARLAQLYPTTHIEALARGKMAPDRMMLNGLLPWMQTNLICTVVPKGAAWQPIFDCGVIIAIHQDVVYNQKRKDQLEVSTLVGYLNSARNSGIMSNDDKIEFFRRVLKFQEQDAAQFAWASAMIGQYGVGTTRMAWIMMEQLMKRKKKLYRIRTD
jgi:hypothetical protein